MKAKSRAIALVLVLCTLLGIASLGAVAEGTDLTEASAATAVNTTGSYAYIKDGNGDGYSEAAGFVTAAGITYLGSSNCTGSYVTPKGGSTTPRTPSWDSLFAQSDYYVYAGGGVKGVNSSNATATDDNGQSTYRLLDGKKFYYKKNGVVDLDTVLGKSAVKFSRGFGVLPTASLSAQQNYVLFNVEGNDWFYSVAGITGSAFNTAASNGNRNNAVVFEVWGSTSATTNGNDGSFVRLAYSAEVLNYNTAEFHVAITGVKTLKLVAKVAADGKNGGTNAFWGSPCVYAVERQQINATMDWGSLPQSEQPQSLELKLLANDTVYSSVTISPATDWQGTWSVPKFDKNGTPISYTLSPIEGYQISGNEVSGYTISPAAAGTTTTFTASLVWDDNDQSANRPGQVVVQLVQNGTPVEGKTAILNEANSWSHTFQDLEMLDGTGAEYIYSATVTPGSYTYTVAPNGVITGTFGVEAEETPETVSITANILWAGNGTKPAKVPVLLYANGGAYSFAELDAAGSWSHTWTVPKLSNGAEVTYTIGSTPVADHTVSQSGNTITYTYTSSGTTPEPTEPTEPSDTPEQPNAYTPSADGTYAGVTHAAEGSQKYLSDMNWSDAFVTPKSGETTPREPKKDANWSGGTIKVGTAGKTFAKGLGITPSAPGKAANYIVYDVSALDVDRLYAVLGITGSAATEGSANYIAGYSVIYNVYGSKTAAAAAEEITTLLATSGAIQQKQSGELNVDITGYKTIKLEVVVGGAQNWGCDAAWADACVYKHDPQGNTPEEEDPVEQPAQPGAYTSSESGSYTGVAKAKDGLVTYLSDVAYTEAVNSSKTNNTAYDHPYGEADTAAIIIGAQDTRFAKGLGVHPKVPGQQAYTIYDVSKLNADRFYAALGITNSKGKDGTADAQVAFKVYGDMGDGKYQLLAQSTTISRKQSGELDVDITGVKNLKLVIECMGTSNASCGSVWANACVYTYDENGSAPEEDKPVDIPVQSNAYTSSANGSYGFISKAKDGKVTYLSDLNYVQAVNSANTNNTTRNYPYGGKTGDKIVIGAKNTAFSKGLGVHPKGPGGEAYTIYDLTGLDVDRFYAAVGITNAKGKSGEADARVSYQVYGDMGDGQYHLLAQSTTLTKKQTGELSVNITGVQKLKLVILCEGSTNASCGSAWAGACVYKYDANGKAPSNIMTVGAQQSTSSTAGGVGNVTPFGGYTSYTGSYASVPEEYFASIQYLADFQYLESSNTTNDAYPEGQPTTINSPYNSSGTFSMGEDDMTFFTGLGVHPKDPKKPVQDTIESWTVYDVSKLNADRFYAVVGLGTTSAKTNSKGVVFRVYGDYGNGSYKMLAQSEAIRGTASGEFDVDISGVKTLRLAVICAGTTHASSSSAWANACVYSTAEKNPLVLPDKPDAQATVPGGDVEPQTQPTEPVDTDTTDTQSTVPVVWILCICAALILAAAVIVILLLRRKQKKQ